MSAAKLRSSFWHRKINLRNSGQFYPAGPQPAALFFNASTNAVNSGRRRERVGITTQ